MYCGHNFYSLSLFCRSILIRSSTASCWRRMMASSAASSSRWQVLPDGLYPTMITPFKDDDKKSVDWNGLDSEWKMCHYCQGHTHCTFTCIDCLQGYLFIASTWLSRLLCCSVFLQAACRCRGVWSATVYNIPFFSLLYYCQLCWFCRILWNTLSHKLTRICNKYALSWCGCYGDDVY